MIDASATGGLLSRRRMLCQVGGGFGAVALLGMLAAESRAAEASNPLAAKPPHFPARAKRVIFLFMHGGVSHVDTFDFKPKLTEMDGQPVPIQKPKFNFAPTGNLLASPWKFSKHGESGIEVSELFPQVAACIDDICVIRTLSGTQVAHGGANLQLHTGSGVALRPSMGAWCAYGLGTQNQNLPGFVVLSPSAYHGGSQNHGSAFLPAVYEATRIGSGAIPFADAKLEGLKPAEARPDLQRLQLDLLAAQNERHLTRSDDDTRLDARIRSFELAFRMQMEAPRVLDISGETAETLALYGVGLETTDDFGRQCLLARRLIENGVRYVQVSHSHPRNYWDAHSNLQGNHSSLAAKVDAPIAGLLRDLKRRGLLSDTLVVWATEFGRTPAAQGKDGRDHHPHAFSVWMAGGGVKGGMTYGVTDEFGYYAVENKVHLQDFHATILHLLGLDHTRLTYLHAGRNFRLTDVAGNVVNGILS